MNVFTESKAKWKVPSVNLMLVSAHVDLAHFTILPMKPPVCSLVCSGQMDTGARTKRSGAFSGVSSGATASCKKSASLLSIVFKVIRIANCVCFGGARSGGGTSA